MRVPLSWLREFAPTDLSPDELADRITHRGVKVEGILRPWDGLDGVVVARVIEVRDHPDSDKLCVARIQHGAGESELVVGVRNMGPGDLVPWAPPGSRIPSLPEPLAARQIRGVVSQGMLCSPRELAISHDHGGILVLDGSAGLEVGADLKGSLGLDDVVLDIEVEPNRPDFLSIYGVAREVAAATGVPLAGPDLALVEADEAAADVATVAVEAPEGCPRYIARVIRDVTHRASPLWAQVRLTAAGMRPIDAVVDATNYAMLELGQPLHGFDLAKLAGPAIVVRYAHDGERLTTLDDVERELTGGDLLICDAERSVAIAGVMGGETSEVSRDTSDVLLESATFTRGGILLTARRLDLHTEASHRFERGVDPEGAEAGAGRGAALIAAWAGGSVLSGVAKAGEPYRRRYVSMRASRATSLLGYEVSAADTATVFDELGIEHRVDGDAVEVEVPGYRPDIELEVDLIEEVVRIQGYEHVGSTLPRAPHAGALPNGYRFARTVKDILVRAGLREIRPAPFASQGDLDLFGDDDAIRVANPLRSEEAFLRTRLAPGLLHAVARNRDLGGTSASLFEVGVTFRTGEPFREIRKAGFVLWGQASRGWATGSREFDVFDAKGVLEDLMGAAGIEGWALGDVPGEPFHPGRSAGVLVRGDHAGVVGEIDPRVLDRLDIEGRVAVGVVGLGPLERARSSSTTLSELPRYPPVRRDLAFVVDATAPAAGVEAALTEAGGELLSSAALFDVFQGGGLPGDRKSVAFAIELRAVDRTLTDEEAQFVVDRIVDRLADEFGAQLRTG